MGGCWLKILKYSMLTFSKTGKSDIKTYVPFNDGSALTLFPIFCGTHGLRGTALKWETFFKLIGELNPTLHASYQLLHPLGFQLSPMLKKIYSKFRFQCVHTIKCQKHSMPVMNINNGPIM